MSAVHWWARFFMWLFQITPDEKSKRKRKNEALPMTWNEDAPAAEKVITVESNDLRGAGCYDAIVNVKSLNVRKQPNELSEVVNVLSEGDQVIVTDVFLGPLYSEKSSKPNEHYVRLMAINGEHLPRDYSVYRSVYVSTQYLSELRPRPYLSPDPEAVG